jgi:hypothetical protein
MRVFSKPDDFMGGIYMIEFGFPEEAYAFMVRYEGCPVWPIMAKGRQANQVFVFSLELKEQNHGDFTQENNTLVKHPAYLGAKEILFRRDDGLVSLFPGHRIQTGYAAEIPCGSNCETCPRFRDPCRGCPAYYKYET